MARLYLLSCLTASLFTGYITKAEQSVQLTQPTGLFKPFPIPTPTLSLQTTFSTTKAVPQTASAKIATLTPHVATTVTISPTTIAPLITQSLNAKVSASTLGTTISSTPPHPNNFITNRANIKKEFILEDSDSDDPDLQDPAKWWKNTWMCLLQWGLIIYSAGSLFALVFMWARGCIDWRLNIISDASLRRSPFLRQHRRRHDRFDHRRIMDDGEFAGFWEAMNESMGLAEVERQRRIVEELGRSGLI